MPTVGIAAVVLLLAGTPVLAQATSPPGGTSSRSESSGTTSATGKMSDQEIKRKLESEGYTNVSDIASTPEGISAKAMKGNKAVTLSIDSSGKVKENQVRP